MAPTTVRAPRSAAMRTQVANVWTTVNVANWFVQLEIDLQCSIARCSMMIYLHEFTLSSCYRKLARMSGASQLIVFLFFLHQRCEKKKEKEKNEERHLGELGPGPLWLRPEQ